uniref:Uncharacterized protein n=1 Tax=Octopus bimaculoides TaxID=37653 RepID=A0A0L8GEI7_OCTBM
MVALGPVYTVGHITSSVRFATVIDDKILFDIFGRKSFLPENIIITTLAKTVCRCRRLNFLCQDAIRIVAKFDDRNMNSSRIPVYLTHSPAGTSTQNMAHFAQVRLQRNFRPVPENTSLSSEFSFSYFLSL